MPKSFKWAEARGTGGRPSQMRLKVAAALLALLNGAALFFYLAPPGGSRDDLEQQRLRIRNEIAAARGQASRMETIAAKVQSGSEQSSAFETKYFLPERTAYLAALEEIQRMAKAAGLQERDAVWSKEPIEGSDDLTLLNVTASYGGTYANLMHFLNETDHSPMLIMLDALTAAPQQKGGEINSAIHFQAIIREIPSATAGVQP